MLMKHLIILNGDKSWSQATIAEMQALDQNNTWELVPLPYGKKIVGCRWVYAIKIGPNGEFDHFKTRWVAKGYTQIYGRTVISFS